MNKAASHDDAVSLPYYLTFVKQQAASIENVASQDKEDEDSLQEGSIIRVRGLTR